MDWDELREAAAAIGAPLAPDQTALLERMEALLRSANAKAALISKSGLADFLRSHVFDALTLIPFLRKASLTESRIVDVGTGAGLPGLVLKIAEPGLRVTLLDATRKKTAYLEEAAAALGLDADVLTARAEEAARDHGLRDAFDAAVCRALAPWPVAMELTLPFCRVGGLLLAQRGADAPREAAAHARTAALLGGRVDRVERVGAEAGLNARHIVAVRKAAPTPARYPRPIGIPAKRPLG